MLYHAVLRCSQFLAAAMREEFGEELAQAEAAAAAVAAEAEQGVTAEQLETDDPEMQQFLSLKQQYHEALQEMGECRGPRPLTKWPDTFIVRGKQCA